MRNKICDNPKCRFYTVKGAFKNNDSIALYIESYLEENEKITFKEKTIKRFRFSTTSIPPFYLCEICYNAVKMTK